MVADEDDLWASDITSAAFMTTAGYLSEAKLRKSKDIFCPDLMECAENFMGTSMLFNLFVGSKDKPVDWKYIGREASLPIRKHKLQRLFNRKVHESMVAFDAFGQTVHPKDVTKAKRDAWKGGGLNVHWDIPAIFQARQRFSRNQREQLREKRRLFSPRMSGLDIVTLGSIPYSYYYDIR